MSSKSENMHIIYRVLCDFTANANRTFPSASASNWKYFICETCIDFYFEVVKTQEMLRVINIVAIVHQKCFSKPFD